MQRLFSTALAGLALLAGVLVSGSSFALGLDPAFPGPAIGPTQAKGVVVWSHGRSINGDDYKSPTPVYLDVLRRDGWDVLRFDRLNEGDTLEASSRRLTGYAASLKRKGYRQVIFAGQSFGGFLSLLAADVTTDVDAVIATAPAAYGNFNDFYDSWRLNATKLYPLLERIKRARVMLFYFHDDEFDPGGRGERSSAILANRGLGYAVVDQPAYLTTHWAASSGLFLRRFGGCIRKFANDPSLTGELTCTPRWGTMPSAELKLPPELANPSLSRVPAVKPPAATGSGAASAAAETPHRVRDLWYGFYPNGREVLLGVEAAHGDDLTAIYAIGPSIDDKHPAMWTRRTGRIVDDSFVFQAKGKSTLHFRPTADGGLAASWRASDGGVEMEAHLKPIDPRVLVERDGDRKSAPIAATAANRDSDKAEN